MVAQAVNSVRGWVEVALGLLWPHRCPVCGGVAGEPETGRVCANCEETIPRITGRQCEVCSRPFPINFSEAFVCQSCRDRQFHFVASLAPVEARETVRDMIHRFKYGKQRWLAEPFALWMAELSSDHRIKLEEIEGLVPVPLHKKREKERGYNQSLLLAEALAKKWKKPVLPVLERVRYTETQTHFDRKERMQNLRVAFRVRAGAELQEKKFLLVDDVFTTGSTLDECARTLLDSGAGAVWAITAARA